MHFQSPYVDTFLGAGYLVAIRLNFRPYFRNCHQTFTHGPASFCYHEKINIVV